jgi:hypothetical protein
MLTLHVTAGLLSLLAGAIALLATKGSVLHRRAGLAFVAAMLVMTGSAVIAAALLRPNMSNVAGGTITAYLVVSALLAVRTVPHARAITVALMLAAALTGVGLFFLGLDAVHYRGIVDRVPAPPYFVLSLVALAGASLDWRYLRAGLVLRGKHRLARHLWRLTFAMWIATGSFFLGQAKHLPVMLVKSGLIFVPVLAVAVAGVHGLWKLFRRQAPKRAPKPSSVATPSSAKIVAATACTARTGIRDESFSPMNTAGTSAISMPSVVPITTSSGAP